MEIVNSKVLMFGEYSVLHNSMALTIPFSKFSGKLCYPKNLEESAIAVLSNKGIREFCKHIVENHADDSFKLNMTQLAQELDKGLFFRSNIPQGFGLGSSGALVAVVFLRYLEKAGEFKDGLKEITMEKIQSLKSYLGGMEGYFHGTSSGIDPLSIIINEPLLLKSNKDLVKVEIPTYNKSGKNVIFLVNTQVARNTENLVNKFNLACEEASFKAKLENKLIQHTNDGINDFLSGNTEGFYKNLDGIVRFQRQEMSYLIPEKYQGIVDNGLENSDYFLKICGSGGGGYMIGFTERWKETKQKLKGEELEIIYRY